MDGGIELRGKVKNERQSSSSGPRVSIGTYQELRPEPTKLEFLPPKRHTVSTIDNKSPESGIRNQLQTELNQTLSRARLRQRLPSSDRQLDDEEPVSNNQQNHNNPASSNVVEATPSPPSIISKEIVIERPKVVAPAPAMSTFGRTLSIEMQAKMASLAVASAQTTSTTTLPARQPTISQSPDNKVTIKVQPYVPRSDFRSST